MPGEQAAGGEQAAQPEHVGSGGLLIDRRRAFELLGRYQLASPYRFVLPWVRAAVAAGAKSVAAFETEDGLELRFDGHPFAAGELGELLNSLPAGKVEPRLQELARGALAALGAGAAFVSVRSGPPEERAALKLAVEEEAVGPVSEEEPRTVVGASWANAAAGSSRWPRSWPISNSRGSLRTWGFRPSSRS